MIISKIFDYYGSKCLRYKNLIVQGKVFLETDYIDEVNADQLIDYIVSNHEKKLRGFFALYYITQDLALCFVDRVRSYPIFYAYENKNLYISDDPCWIAKEIGDFLEESKLEDFKLVSFTMEKSTLFSRVKQLEAGEKLVFCNNKLSITRYDRLHYLLPEKNMYYDLYQNHESVLNLVFENLIRYANGRSLVVPLSGGYDSRLIAMMLKKMHYENIVTFTYGDVKSKDVQLSRLVAENLNLNWIYIQASPSDYKSVVQTKEYAQYFLYAGKMSSVPHMQDWYAVKYMKDHKMIPEDSIFVPGHVGDILSGECSDRKKQLYKVEKIDYKKAAAAIVDYLFTEKILSRKEIKRYRKIVSDAMKTYKGVYNSASIYENWWLYERTAKFIVNSVRTYEFFGYDWWLPFADYEYFRFWETISLKDRINQNLYQYTITSLMKELMDVIIPREGEESKIRRSIRSFFSRFLSINTRNIVKKYILNQNEILEKQYYGGLNPIWYYCVDNIEDYKKCKTQCSSVNYALANQYIELVKNNMSININDINRGCDL